MKHKSLCTFIVKIMKSTRNYNFLYNSNITDGPIPQWLSDRARKKGSRYPGRSPQLLFTTRCDSVQVSKIQISDNVDMINGLTPWTLVCVMRYAHKGVRFLDQIYSILRYFRVCFNLHHPQIGGAHAIRRFTNQES